MRTLIFCPSDFLMGLGARGEKRGIRGQIARTDIHPTAPHLLEVAIF
jgi:hypothetical protein